jgi:hypothetical protein
MVIATAPAAAPHNPGFSQTGICIGFSFHCGRTDLLPSARGALHKWVHSYVITSPKVSHRGRPASEPPRARGKSNTMAVGVYRFYNLGGFDVGCPR